MSDTVDDFMRRFGGNDTIDDQEAERYHERFASKNDEDRDFDNSAYHDGATEYLGRLPQQEFREKTSHAIRNAPPEQRGDLLGTLLGSLTGGSGSGAAGGLGGLASILGLGSSDPQAMSEDDATKVIDYARREDPAALRRTVEEKPWFIKALGNPVVMGALTAAAAKLLSNRSRR